MISDILWSQASWTHGSWSFFFFSCFGFISIRQKKAHFWFNFSNKKALAWALALANSEANRVFRLRWPLSFRAILHSGSVPKSMITKTRKCWEWRLNQSMNLFTRPLWRAELHEMYFNRWHVKKGRFTNACKKKNTLILLTLIFAKVRQHICRHDCRVPPQGEMCSKLVCHSCHSCRAPTSSR